MITAYATTCAAAWPAIAQDRSKSYSSSSTSCRPLKEREWLLLVNYPLEGTALPHRPAESAASESLRPHHLNVTDGYEAHLPGDDGEDDLQQFVQPGRIDDTPKREHPGGIADLAVRFPSTRRRAEPRSSHSRPCARVRRSIA